MVELQSSYALVWLVIAIILGCIEVVSTSLGFILASFAAVISCVLAVRHFNFETQVISFAVITVLSLTVFRPGLVRLMQRGTKNLPGRAEALVGQSGQVTDEITNGQGRITVLDQDWSARSLSNLKSGTAIRVVGHDGIVLLVEEVK